jgi:hypothetical protein
MKTRTLCIAIALAFAPGAFAAYKCVDEKGITRIGETPPDECAKVPMQEIRGSSVIRTIPPSLTPEQVKAREEEAEKTRQAQKEAAEQQRKDLALLNTYASDREIDMTRDRNVEPINARIKVAKERIEAIDKRTKQLEDEMEFYKAGKTGKGKDAGRGGDQLKADLASLQKEKATIEKSIKGYEKEIESTKAKYDVDKKRWLALKSGGPIPGAGAPK